MSQTLRPPAVPLVTIDPFVSVWSDADHLYDAETKHWSYEREKHEGVQGMVGLISIDGKVRRFLGSFGKDVEDQPEVLPQVNLKVDPLITTYTFEGEGIRLEVEFMTPLLLDDLDVLSRPASYVTFHVQSLDGKDHDVSIYFDVTGEWCVHDRSQEVKSSRSTLEGGMANLSMGTVEQPVLERVGDLTRIDWGYVHLVVPNVEQSETVIHSTKARSKWVETGSLPTEDQEHVSVSVEEGEPILATTLSFGQVTEEKQTNFLVIGYDDVYSIEYFGDRLVGYWKRNGMTVDEMLMTAVNEYEDLRDRCIAFGEQLKEDAEKAGGEKYVDIVSLAYRQSIAAHKLVEDKEGNILFLSKECNSNGCIGTVDVSYPSTPLYLLYNPELVKGMMRPIFRYARTDDWEFEFAPHDVGTYPKANGQVYGEKKLEFQMPIEECGNMLIMAANVAVAEGNADFAKENWDLLTQWANYLLENGLDPGHQLCTDDFAGHLARNANLSIKAIMGIASYQLLCEMLGEEYDAEIPKEMAQEWLEMADDGDHYRLAFDQEDSWSLKYNLIWDDFLSFGLFPKKVREKEVAYYLKQKSRYGTPLDNRETYTKTDWLVWAAGLTDDQEETEALIAPIWDMLNETNSRVPFTDWYDTKDAHHKGFRNRTVIGGVFILLMKHLDWKKI